MIFETIQYNTIQDKNTKNTILSDIYTFFFQKYKTLNNVRRDENIKRLYIG